MLWLAVLIPFFIFMFVYVANLWQLVHKTPSPTWLERRPWEKRSCPVG